MERLTAKIKRPDKEDLIVYTKGTYEDTIPAEMTKNDIRAILKKLAAYEDAEEQGLLLRLPCKVGDTVYSLDRFCGGYSSDCPSRPCKDCPDYKLEIHEEKFKLNNIYDFDKTVFLTQEKAEAKRKEMEGSHE